MISKPPHNRRLGLLGVALTRTRVSRFDGKALEDTQNELEPMLVGSGYLDGAPFWWVTVSLRYGLKNEDAPHYQQINRKYGDLPLGIEVDVHRLIGATLEGMKAVFREAALKSLIHAGEKFGRPTAQLKAELKKLLISQEGW